MGPICVGGSNTVVTHCMHWVTSQLKAEVSNDLYTTGHLYVRGVSLGHPLHAVLSKL